MARLNNTPSPRKRQEPRAPLGAQTKPERGLSNFSLPKTTGNSTSRGLFAETRTTKDNGATKEPSSARTQSHKKSKSSLDFQIFPDNNALFYDEAEETEEEHSDTSESHTSPTFSPSSSIGSISSHDKTKNPLKLAHVNSMLLPMPSPPSPVRQRRQTRKSEILDYAKENDPIEEPGDDDLEAASLSRSSSDASSRRIPVQGNVRQIPGGGNRNNNLSFSSYRQLEIEEADSEDPEDNGSDLEGFIVSDNEDLSFHDVSENESTEEEEKMPSPPPKPRRRLMRGRRPASTGEPKPDPEPEEVNRKSWKVPKEQSPIMDTIPPMGPTSTRLSQESFNINEELDNLNLDDNNNDPSSQLFNDLNDAVIELNTSPKKPAYEPPNLQTPPSSPSKNNRLRSPTKNKVCIPPTPYRESTDAFWSQETTNDWVDQHSPKKLDQLLREFKESDDEHNRERSFDIMPRSRNVKGKEPKSPSKTAQKKAEIEHRKALMARKKSFDDKKASLAYDFLKVLDIAVAGGQVQEMANETGGVKIVWSKTLQTTAGRATWKRVRDDNGCDARKPTKHYAIIELAERIIDNEDRLINTLAHEYCHLANHMISKVYNNPHGASFKQWGLKCKQALQDHPVYAGRIEVTTKHSYKIDYKYVWTCVDCAQNYGRHSKSIDPTKSRCGRCKGILQQIKPKPRNVSPKKKPAAGASTGLGIVVGGAAAQGSRLSPVDTKAVDDVMQVLGGVSLH